MDVCEVIKEELGKYPDELFESFSEKPIASASLAQVHVAIEKGTGRKLAVKVQHRGLRETSVGDLKALETAIGVIDGLFEDFTYGWIVVRFDVLVLCLICLFMSEAKTSQFYLPFVSKG